MTYEIVFWAAAALAVASALGVVLSGNPFHSALWLIVNLASLATFYLLLSADFLAAAQVVVYAGAVMIMFLFVIAYLGGRADEPTRDTPWWQIAAAIIAGGAIMAEVLVAVLSHSFGQSPSVPVTFGSPAFVGQIMLSRYLLAFEATSVLLLVAAVGGVLLGARRPDMRPPGAEEPFAPEAAPEVELPLQAFVMEAETDFPVQHVPAPDEEEAHT